MRSEDEIKLRIATLRAASRSFAAQELEWVINEPKEEPLTQIELRELRAIMKAKRSDCSVTPAGNSLASNGTAIK